MPDSDGYPTDEELDRIATWPANDLPGWFTFIRSCWWHPGWGWREQCMEDSLSTGGWSGNEDIINVMYVNIVRNGAKQRRGVAAERRSA